MDFATIGQKQLVIVGATGMAGGYALDQPDVGRVTAISRRGTGISHPKLHEVRHQDFGDCSAPAPALLRQDATVICLETYTGAVPEVRLHSVTVNYAIEFAGVLRANSPDPAFWFLSGSGADPSARSRMAFARYKEETGNAPLASEFPNFYIFRPASIYPMEPRKEPNFSYRVLRGIFPLFRALFPNQVFRADDLARAMVDVVATGTGVAPSQVIENRNICSMAHSLHGLQAEQEKGRA